MMLLCTHPSHSSTTSIKLPSTNMAKLIQQMDLQDHMVTGTCMESHLVNNNGQYKPSLPWFRSTRTLKTHRIFRLSNSRKRMIRKINGLSSQTAEVTRVRSPSMLTWQMLLLLAARRHLVLSTLPTQERIEKIGIVFLRSNKYLRYSTND